MPQNIKLQQTSSKTTKILNPALIDETGTTRRVVFFEVVDNPNDPDACIKGTILHQRKGPSKQWENLEAESLSKLKTGEAVQMHFSCSQMKKLREALAKAYAVGEQGVLPTDVYMFGTRDELIATDKDKRAYIQKLLDQDYGEDIWEQLVDAKPDLVTRLSYARIHQDRICVLEQFKRNLIADLPESFWQKFLSENDWIFGYGLSYITLSCLTDQAYVGGKDIKGTNGRMCDFLAGTVGDARFTVLVEIKKPNTPLLDKQDRNRSFPISSDLAKAVSQIQGYCDSWTRHLTDERMDFENENRLTTVQPKGIVVIGDTSELNTKDKRRSFELFRRNLHNPEIITYDELLARTQFILREQNDMSSVVEDDGLPF